MALYAGCRHPSSPAKGGCLQQRPPSQPRRLRPAQRRHDDAVMQAAIAPWRRNNRRNPSAHLAQLGLGNLPTRWPVFPAIRVVSRTTPAMTASHMHGHNQTFKPSAKTGQRNPLRKPQRTSNHAADDSAAPSANPRIASDNRRTSNLGAISHSSPWYILSFSME